MLLTLLFANNFFKSKPVEPVVLASEAEAQHNQFAVTVVDEHCLMQDVAAIAF